MGGGATLSAPTLAVDAAAQAAAQAASAAAQGSASLTRATTAIQAMQAAQAAARAAASSSGGVPNGLTVGGLVPDSGLAAGGIARPVVSWTNARTPMQSGPSDAPTVTVQQTGAQAILNWSSFNIGANTSLVFDQQGNSSWVALNRVGASSSPSRILGSIRADGSIYIINQNGIIFGGASQITVGSLIASAASITDNQFLTYGIYSTAINKVYNPSFTAAGGTIVVEAGASIATAAPKTVTSGGGSVILLGTEVRNAGSISTPKGQTVLAAGDSFILRSGYATDGNTTSTTRGVEVAPVRASNSQSGAVGNSGLVFAQQGDITLAGHSVTQDGILVATTSVDQRGTVHLLNSITDPTGSVTVADGALTAVLPELDSKVTALDSQRDALIADSTKQNSGRAAAANDAPQFNNLSRLDDRQDQSRVEIVSGGLVTFRRNSLTLAQGGQIAVSSVSDIRVETLATLDVSGTTGTVLPASANNLKVNIQPNEMRDSPVNRDSGVLVSKDAWIDIRDLVLVPAGTGGYASDRYYTKGGLLEVGGYLGNTGHTIGEWTAVGGTVTLAAGRKVIAERGALIDLSGGMVNYAAGDLLTTMVIGADGRIYSIGNAPADMPIISYGSGFTRDHARWGQKETWGAPAHGAVRSFHQDAYSVGRDAGLLQILAATSDFKADIDAAVYTGERQTTSRPSTKTDGYKLTQTQPGLPGQLLVGTVDIGLGNGGTQTSGIVLFAGPGATQVTAPSHVFDAAEISAMGLGGLSVFGSSEIEGDLTLAPGAIVSLSVNHLGGNITARGGSVTLSVSSFDPGVTVDTRGLWTNALLDPTRVSGLAYRNGGAITVSGSPLNGYDLVIPAGVRLDASAGGAILSTGKFSGGNGGDITLGGNSLALNGEVVSNGFGKGGKLALSTSGAMVIGPSPLPGGTLAAGEAAPVLLVLASPVTLARGTVAPFSITMTITSVAGGQLVPAGAQAQVSSTAVVTVGSAGWTVPAGIFYAMDTTFHYYYPGSTVPAGTILQTMAGNFSSGYVLPPNSFTTPLRLSPINVNFAAGSVLAYDAVLSKGYVLPAGAVLPQSVEVAPVLALDPSLFQKGFSSYAISSGLGITVQPGLQIEVVEPTYQFSRALVDLPTGGRVDTAASLALAPLFAEDALRRTLNQRPGADLVLTARAAGLYSSVALANEHAAAPITIGSGASISVDPGRSVSLFGDDQITIEGEITARGGSISAFNLTPSAPLTANSSFGRSVWIGSNAVLDVSGIAHAATDSRGRRYGTVTDGGSIVLGTDETPTTDGMNSGNAFVVIRPGALIDASGASAVLDVLGEGPALVAGNGGSIRLSSLWGFAIDGTMRAAAGGVGASGGSLSLTLESPIVAIGAGASSTLVQAATAGRVIAITQDTTPTGLTDGLAPGVADAGLVLGSGRLSAAQVKAGGFDSLSLWGRSAIAFDGDVNLSLGRSLVLQQGKIVNTAATGKVTLAAPYVFIDGHTLQANTLHPEWTTMFADRLPVYAKGASFSVSADLVDIRNLASLAYEMASVASSGDIRFLKATERANARLVDYVTILAAGGDLDLTAAQIYPASGAVALAAAGGIETAGDTFGFTRFNDAGSRLTVHGTGAVPDMPYSVFGNLTLLAETIEQGGVVRAPMGQIQFGDFATPAGRAVNTTRLIEFMPGSITSVSADGLIVPYGGTADGIRYTVDGGAPVTPSLVNGLYRTGASGSTSLYVGVGVAGISVQTDAGSLIDLSGGGTLAGAAFISGRGGSVDPLLTPLANAGIHGFSSAGNKVYAIVPGTFTAPAAGGYNNLWTGGVPTIGQQITIPAGVPGLPAGTYTLLPANYALLPGAYRVELGARTDQAVNPVALANGSYVLTGHQAVAHTNIQDALATRLVITPADAVRNYAQFNEQSYGDFVLSTAAQFGTRRTMVEADAKFLTIDLGLDATVAANSALKVNGIIDFAAAAGGIDGSLFLTTGDALHKGALVITAPGSATANTASRTTVSSSTLAAVGAPNLVLGGRPYDNNTYVSVDSGNLALVDSLTIEAGVRVSASQVLAFAGTTITLQAGAEINTLGRGFSGLDSRSGLAFGTAPQSYPSLYTLLVVSNGSIILNANTGLGSGGIVMNDGAALYSEGTIGFYAPTGLQTSGSIKLGTRNLALSVASLNIGSAEALAAVPNLPVGLRFDQGFLDTLLSGGGAAGAPAVEHLVMTAGQSINFFGSSDLSTFDPLTGRSRLDELVLASPAIYGYGSGSDSVHLATNRLVWTGGSVFDPVATGPSSTPQFKSATPPERLAGLGNSGALVVDAREVVFGYPAEAQSDSNLVFNRLMLGFDTAVFNAAERVTANNKGTVSVYAGGPAIGGSFDPASYQGVGGTLVFNTPAITGDAGANLAIYGGAVTLTQTGAVAGPAGGLGATLSVTADTLRVDTAVLLPGGALTLTARQDLLIDSRARLDLSGHAVAIGQAVSQVWAGDVTLVSLNGNVTLAAGSIVDLSSDGSDAGTFKLRAAGAARFAGALLASGGGNGARDGAFDLAADSLGGGNLSADFAALNQRLNAEGFAYSRAFVFGSGNLAVGSDVKARNVTITADGGSLTVDGRIDASGLRSGAIRLAARDDVVLTGNAVLDVHGTQLVVDSYGQAIEASNRNSIELGTSQGWIRIGGGATLDTSSPDGISRGRVEINARRSSETGGDVNIDAPSPLNLRGIASLAVNGYWTYSPTDANGTIVQDDTAAGVVSGAVGLAQIDATNQTFYANALGNNALQARLAGLKTVGAAYHFRPGVEIVSSAASGGKLTVVGDLDLAGFRYGPNADRNTASATYGFGEPLALMIRASGNLTIKGSITDGFAEPKSSPDEVNFRDRPQNGVVTVIPAYAPPYDDYTPTEDMTLGEDWVLPYYWYDGESRLYVSTDRGYFYSGDLIPAGTKILWTGDTYFYFGGDQLVPAAADIVRLSQGKIYAIAPMLAPGAMSASIRLVGGADLASGDSRALLPADRLGNSGNIVLDDYHTHSPTKMGADVRQTEIASVIRTGTGDLDLLAGGSLTERSLYAVYTAGTQQDLASGNSAYIINQPSIQLPSGTGLESTFNDRANYFPDHGGDLRVTVQGNLAGYNAQLSLMRDGGEWLMLQGAPDLGQATGWSVNFGNYKGAVYVSGPLGFGTYGGGNATVVVGGAAGGITTTNIYAANRVTTGLSVAVGATGRVLADGTLIETGGGDLSIQVGGRLNPLSDGGQITNLRGSITLQAAEIGSRGKVYATSIAGDPRPAEFTSGANIAYSFAGPSLRLGDAAASIRTLGTAWLGSVGEIGINQAMNPNAYGDVAGPANTSIVTWFSLFQPSTAVDMVSLGGDLAPFSANSGDGLYLPPQFTAAALSGNIYASAASKQVPAARAGFELLAQGSIYGYGSIVMSAADPALLPTPFHPAFAQVRSYSVFLTNATSQKRGDLFAFAPDQPTSDVHAGDPEPVRIYAANGDIVGLWLTTAKRLDMAAGGDIVMTKDSQLSSSLTITHANATDVSTVTAGGKIIYPRITAKGPGEVSITADSDIFLGDLGSIVSTGPAYAADQRPGASIGLLAGAGAAGPNYAAIATLYLDPANRAVSGTPLADQAGRVAKTYEAELRQWLAIRYGYVAASDADARVYFGNRAPEEQAIFLRQVYFAELKVAGREYNDPASVRYGSYFRGRQVIATLFPDRDASGEPIAYDGDFVMFGDSGVRTIAGGDITVLTPGGRQVLGVEGKVPAGTAGVITQGQGDISLYSKGSILLGLSRIMTTYGGSILAWSAEGDINAGRGSKTTLVYTPPKRIYDRYGKVTLAPQVPSTGAGIATLNPVPGTTAGDIDLIAPLGTIDAGEAGIRVSGDINLVALQIVNAANIQVQGTSSGLPTVQAPPVAALTAAGNVAGAATPAAVAPAQANDRPSIILVEFLGFGGGDGGSQPAPPLPRDRRNDQDRQSYDPDSAFRAVGHGRLTEQQRSQLTARERAKLDELMTRAEVR
nr:filamentous haemagglutinin family protein [Rhodopseudomonas palustris]